MVIILVDDGGVRKSTEFSDYDDPAKEVSLSEYTKNTLSEESDSEVGTVSMETLTWPTL